MEDPANCSPVSSQPVPTVIEQLLRSDNKPRVALLLIEQAISLLDQTDAPGEIAAYLDLARCRLTDAMELQARCKP